MDIEIRKVLPEEAGKYTDCHIACWQSAYRGIIPDEYLNNMESEYEQRTERCKKTLSESGDFQYYCVMLEEKMIGRLIFGKSRDEDKCNAGEVMAIYLIKEHWDKGYGRRIMDFAVNELKRSCYNELLLWVLEDNVRARRFYEKYGFVFDGTKKEIKIEKPLIEIRYIMYI